MKTALQGAPLRLPRVVLSLFCATVCFACMTAREISPEVMQAAECVADVLRNTPGTSEIQTRTLYGNDGAKPSVEWRLPDDMGRLRLTRVVVTASYDNGFFAFRRAEGRLAPDPMRLVMEWESRCHVREYEPLLITT